jgi:hypothetical protein
MKYAKAVGALVAAVLGVGVSVLIPGIDPAWAASLTGLLTVIGTVVSPKNVDDTQVPPATANRTYLDN